MSSHLILLPSHFSSVQAIEPGHSKSRHIAASLANIKQIVQPGSCANFQALVSDIYQQYTDQPDIPANGIGLTKEQALAYLTAQGIAYIDLTPELSDVASFKHEIQAQNISGVLQLFVLNDGSQLKHGVSGLPLHNWATSPSATSLIRVGYSDDVPNAYYIDSELSLAFEQPVPVSWDSVNASGILACFAILPASVEAPPADFRYFAGVDANGAMLPPNVWPVPAPTVNVESAVSSATALLTVADQLAAAAAAIKSSAQSVLSDLGKAS